MIKFVLLTLCILGRLIAADSSTLPSGLGEVDKQIAVWKSIHATKRQITNFSDTQTHFPPILERIAYMAVYVRTAIAGIKTREARVDEIMSDAEFLCKEGKLTFQAATGLFWNLAATCDKEEELPESINKEAARPESMLNKGDLVYLCVPTGGLKISRYVDGYLRPTQLTYIALPNQALKNGPHGISTVRSFFVHDTGHSADSIVDPVIWQTMWPFFERIATYRTKLTDHSLEKRMIDVLLFHYFHENFSPYVLGSDLEQGIKNKSKIYFNSEILLYGEKMLKKFWKNA